VQYGPAQTITRARHGAKDCGKWECIAGNEVVWGRSCDNGTYNAVEKIPAAFTDLVSLDSRQVFYFEPTKLLS
jgi:hypothetical protein